MWRRVARVAVVVAVLLGFGAAAHAGGPSNSFVRIEGILGGANGDSSIQYIEISMLSLNERFWGPDADPDSRAILTFHDGSGAETDRYMFPNHAPSSGVADTNGHYSVLIATSGFEQASGIAADFVLPDSLLIPVDGMVCFRNNPDNPNATTVNLCVSYGKFAGAEVSDMCPGNDTNGPPLDDLMLGGLPVATPTTVQGLIRNANDATGESLRCYETGGGNADFALAEAIARNSQGDQADVAVASTFVQGKNVFDKEKFNGNGRTCATCHVEGDTTLRVEIVQGVEPQTASFALPPFEIASVCQDVGGDCTGPDPLALFINETEPGLADLEDTCLLRQGNQRGLVLENIDGFGVNPSFRSTPHLLNIGLSGPYGLSGDVELLRNFPEGAIRQHLPKTLARVEYPDPGPPDFRVPTEFEKDVLDEFMRTAGQFPPAGTLGANDIDTVSDLGFTSQDRDTFLDALIAEYMIQFPAADLNDINMGRSLYFDEAKGQCGRCHNGQALDTADGSLGTDGNGPIDVFDIGVQNIVANDDDGCSGGTFDPTLPLPLENNGVRDFHDSPLIGIARTAPFFHDASAPTLRDAVVHYTSGRFRNSPAGQLLPTDIDLTKDPVGNSEVDRIVDFLNAVSFVPEPTRLGLQIAAIGALGLLARRRR